MSLARTSQVAKRTRMNPEKKMTDKVKGEREG